MRAVILLLWVLSLAGANVYFSPYGGARQALVDLISHSNQSMDAAVYSFTSKELGLALASAAQHGVHVRVILDSGQSHSSSSVVSWLSQYVDIRLMHVEGERGIMHHKFLVVGNKIVATGSYNWTNNAELFNNENLLILNDAALASQYENEFEKLWKQARPLH